MELNIPQHKNALGNKEPQEGKGTKIVQPIFIHAVTGKEYGNTRISEHETTDEKMNKRCVCAYLLQRNFGQEGE